MFSCHSVSFGGNATCNKCIIFVALEVTVFELEGQLCSVEKPANSRVLLPSLAPTTIDSPPAFFYTIIIHGNTYNTKTNGVYFVCKLDLHWVYHDYFSIPQAQGLQYKSVFLCSACF